MIEFFQKIWDLLKLVMGGFWRLLSTAWPFLSGVAIFFASFWAKVMAFIDDVVAKVTALYDIFTGSQGDLRAAISSGFPPDILLALRYVNAFVPVDSFIAWALVLLFVSGLSAIIRVIKAWIPTVN